MILEFLLQAIRLEKNTTPLNEYVVIRSLKNLNLRKNSG